MEWMEEYGLILMNATQKCRGVYTRIERGKKSAIDLVLVNKKIYEICEDMEIDEEKREICFSDHTMVTLELSNRQEGGVNMKKGGWIEKTYYSKKEEMVKDCATDVIKNWEEKENLNIDEICKDMKESADKFLKKKLRIKTGNKGKEKIIEEEWMKDEIRQNIKIRNILNRRKRNYLD